MKKLTKKEKILLNAVKKIRNATNPAKIMIHYDVFTDLLDAGFGDLNAQI